VIIALWVGAQITFFLKLSVSLNMRGLQDLSTSREPDNALSTAPDYPDEEESTASSGESSDLDIGELPGPIGNSGPNRPRTFSFPGSSVKLQIKKQLVYHFPKKKRKTRNRHRSDSCGESSKKHSLHAPPDIRRGATFPLLSECITEESSSFDVEGKTRQISVSSDTNGPAKPSFGFGVDGDDFTGLEDEPPIEVQSPVHPHQRLSESSF